MDQDFLSRVSLNTRPFQVALIAAAEKWQITVQADQDAWLANCAHESQIFTRTSENLNYSAAGLIATFPSHFPADGVLAAKYAKHSIAIANFVYASKNGNGDETSGDGWKNRGQGLIQLTFHDNILAYSMAMYGDDRVVKNPSVLQLPNDAANSAAWFWTAKGCSKHAAAGDFIGAVRIVNPRLEHLDDRQHWLKLIQEARNVPA